MMHTYMKGHNKGKESTLCILQIPCMVQRNCMEERNSGRQPFHDNNSDSKMLMCVCVWAFTLVCAAV